MSEPSILAVLLCNVQSQVAAVGRLRAELVDVGRLAFAPFASAHQVAQRAKHFGLEDFGDATADDLFALEPVNLFERAVPIGDPPMKVDHHNADADRFDDVLVEIFQAGQLFGAPGLFFEQQRVFNRHRDVTRDGAQQGGVFRREQRAVGRPSKRQNGDHA